ncbi:hypothetical protein SDC9_57689 [bioreactor metagenome]|uniref:Uncharacterized protein n=1 Tax=bioreactor metagenome TaxID=1076179 RepID=A0A644X5A9_9ZZZZ
MSDSALADSLFQVIQSKGNRHIKTAFRVAVASWSGRIDHDQQRVLIAVQVHVLHELVMLAGLAFFPKSVLASGKEPNNLVPFRQFKGLFIHEADHQNIFVRKVLKNDSQ